MTPFRKSWSEQDGERGKTSCEALSETLASTLRQAGEGARLVAWMSDIHSRADRPYSDLENSIYRARADASFNFRQALTELSALRPKPDLLIFGGDLADSGCEGEAPVDEIETFGHWVNGHCPKDLPTLALLGNHDHADKPLSAAFRSAFEKISNTHWPRQTDPDDYYGAAHLFGWRFVILDSRQGQALSEKQFTWLSQLLKKDSSTPTLVLVHRPFLAVGNWVDNHRLIDRRSFDLIHNADCVKGVFSGHTHKSAGWQFNGKIHAVFPGLAYGIGESCGWVALVLSKDKVHSIFIKDLAAETFDHVAFRLHPQSGSFRKLETPLYEDSPLCDPCLLPRRDEPNLRD